MSSSAKNFVSRQGNHSLPCCYWCLFRQALEVQLEQRRAKLNVEILISALTKTLDFEKELCERFGPQIAEVQVAEHDKEDGTTMIKQVQKFQGIVSSAFDLYLDFYIKNLDE